VDNVTHILAGVVVADAVWLLHVRRRRNVTAKSTAANGDVAATGLAATNDGALRSALFASSVLANNAPDFDFLYSGITPGKLGYLLHHRGHTHTLVAALPLGLLGLALIVALLRLRGQRLPRAAYGLLAGVAALGGALHLLFDFANTYGVHPFWPLDERWYYGDALFIVEPWLMIVLAGMALGASRSRAAKLLLTTVIGILLAMAWGTGLLTTAWCIALSVAGPGWLAWQHRASARQRWYSGGLALLALLSVHLGARSQVRASVESALAGQARWGSLALASMPLPGNPLCWQILAAGTEGEHYVVRRGLASAWPALASVDGCGPVDVHGSAPLVAAVSAPPNLPGLRWGSEFRAPFSELSELARQDCVARAFLRFARMPFWLPPSGGTQLIGDLRFDRSPAVEFAEIELAAQSACPTHLPPWQPPLPLR
jgi:inner membrane protein